MKKIGIILCLFSSMALAQKEVLIITTVFNQPSFIELQDKTFKIFMEDRYQFVVFNDARIQS